MNHPIISHLWLLIDSLISFILCCDPYYNFLTLFDKLRTICGVEFRLGFLITKHDDPHLHIMYFSNYLKVRNPPWYVSSILHL